MIALASMAVQTFLGKFWWQVPLVLALLLGVARWDYKRIEKKVEAAKVEVVQEIRGANDKAVETADRVRAKSAAPSVRSISRKERDPYTVD